MPLTKLKSHDGVINGSSRGVAAETMFCEDGGELVFEERELIRVRFLLSVGDLDAPSDEENGGGEELDHPVGGIKMRVRVVPCQTIFVGSAGEVVGILSLVLVGC